MKSLKWAVFAALAIWAPVIWAQKVDIIDQKAVFKLRGGAPALTQETGGTFGASIPQQAFTCQPGPQTITCVGNFSVRAQLTIRSDDSPSKKPLTLGDLGLLGLNRVENFQKNDQISNFKLLSSEQTSVDGNPAVVQTFTYNNLSNVQLPVWVRVLNASQGLKLFTIQMECTSSQCGEYQEALRLIFGSFRIAKLDASGRPVKIDASDPKVPDSSGNPLLDQIVNELER